MSTLQKSDKQMKNVFLIGAIAAVTAVAGMLTDIIAGSILGADLNTLPHNAVERFTQINNNTLIGLYNLDMLNMFINIILVLAFYAVFIAHRNADISLAGLALILFVIGNTIFIVNNAALPMLDLASKYVQTNDPGQKTLLMAAGEALLAKGSHGSPGVFLGFVIPVVADVVMSIAMLNSRIFGRITAYTGICGNLLLMAYLILVTFVPQAKSIALILAMPGGLLSLAWMVMIAVKLFELSKKELSV